MATYATRLTSAVLGPMEAVVERARRWSSSTEERPPLPVDTTSVSSSSSGNNGTSNAADPALNSAASPQASNSLTPVFEDLDIDVEESASEQTLVIVDPLSAFRAPVPTPTTESDDASSPARAPQSMSAATDPSESSSSTTADSTQTPATTPRSSKNKSSALPEDDGQQVLRQKLVAITNSNLTERERAKRMQMLMTEKYNSSRAAREIPGPDSSPHSPALLETDTELNNPYKLSAADIAKTYRPPPVNSESACFELGCSHYRRGVKLQCSTCERWHTCRFCHDEKEDHTLIRRETKNMLCMHCGKPQPARQDCEFCGIRSARYYCDKCKLWDDDPEKSIYHCNDCGICRIGQGLGKDYFHCKKCGVCMSKALEGSHRCIECSTKCDCPICGEFMFTSTLTVVFMSCGHSIHRKCYYEHMKNSYRCPTCARTIVNMESQFRALDAEIEKQPLPHPYDSWRCLITCNDCSAKSNVSFHFLGLKCETCKSYNTSQVRILRPEDGTTAEAGNSTSPSIATGLGRVDSSASLILPQLSSPPRSAAAEGVQLFGGRTAREGDNTLVNANRVIAAADEAIDATNMVIVDDGWESEEDSSGFDDDFDDDEDDDDGDVSDEVLEDEDDEEEEDDDSEDEMELIGHR
ncbi:hypothetical protein RUND412_000431 [Rhizina undulata]